MSRRPTTESDSDFASRAPRLRSFNRISITFYTKYTQISWQAAITFSFLKFVQNDTRNNVEEEVKDRFETIYTTASQLYTHICECHDLWL